MDRVARFADPWSWYGLRAWRTPQHSRLISRLKKIRTKDTIPSRRGYLILRELLGEGVDRLGPLDMSHAYQRLLVVEWTTGFEAIGFFTESEIRAYATLDGPPQDSVLGRFWDGLLSGEDPHGLEQACRRQSFDSASRPAVHYSGPDDGAGEENSCGDATPVSRHSVAFAQQRCPKRILECRPERGTWIAQSAS